MLLGTAILFVGSLFIGAGTNWKVGVGSFILSFIVGANASHKE